MDIRSGQVAVVTGAAMGLGKEIALRLNQLGASLSLCDKNLEALARVQAECKQDASHKVTIHDVDVENGSRIEELVSEIRHAHGDCIHLLFNNAGIVIPGSFATLGAAEFDKVVSVNLGGTVAVTRALWPLLLAAAPNRAAVVNMSSIAAFWPPASGGSMPYTVSKYAIRGFSEQLALECKTIAPHILVTCVHPAAVKTEIVNNSLSFIQGGQQGEPTEEDIQKVAAVKEFFDKYGRSAKNAAEIIVDGVIAGKTRILVGADATIIDWWMRMFPHLFLFDTGNAAILLTAAGGNFYGRLAALAAVACVGLFMKSQL